MSDDLVDLLLQQTRAGKISWSPAWGIAYVAKHGGARLVLSHRVQSLRVEDRDKVVLRTFHGQKVRDLHRLIREGRNGDVLGDLVESLRGAGVSEPEFSRLVTEAHSELDARLAELFPDLDPGEPEEPADTPNRSFREAVFWGVALLLAVVLSETVRYFL